MTKHLAVATAALALLLSLWVYDAVSQPDDGFVPGGGNNPGVGDQPGVGDDTPQITPVDVVIPNASFEQGTDAPEQWTTHTGEVAGEYSWDAAVFSTGMKSISTHGTRWGYGRWSSALLGVESDGYQWYTLSGKAKTAANNGEVYLSIAWYDKEIALITTSDSPMLGAGDNDWSTLTVNALPPAGAVYVGAWCISNHNDGQTWFDDVDLTRTHFPAAGATSYDQFLIDQPTHPLAIEANVMQVQQLITEAKWTMEDDFFDTDNQLAASKLYGKAANVQRNDAVYTNVFTALHDDATERAAALADAQARFDGLINRALWKAAVTSEAGGDTTASEAYESLLEGRGQKIGPLGATIEPVNNNNANPQ